MKINNPMRELLKEVDLEVSLNSSLQDIVGHGFEDKEDCYFMAALFRGSTNVTRDSFQDATGYECFINSLHIEDYGSEDPLSQAIKFVEKIFYIWNIHQKNIVLAAIISSDEFSVVTKFHVKRAGENWINEDVNNYEDPIMFISSSEDVLESIASAK